MLVWAYPLLWLAAIIGGVFALSMDQPWGWFLLVPAGAVLIVIHVQRLWAEIADWGRLPFASRDQWIGIRGFLSGFAAAVCLWGVTIDTGVGRAMSVIGFLVIGACLYAGAVARR